MTGYVLSVDADLDLDEIWEYIAADNIDAANRWIGTLFDAFEALARAFAPNLIVAMMVQGRVNELSHGETSRARTHRTAAGFTDSPRSYRPRCGRGPARR
jgi:plasmid stabilization system protein ParE